MHEIFPLHIFLVPQFLRNDCSCLSLWGTTAGALIRGWRLSVDQMVHCRFCLCLSSSVTTAYAWGFRGRQLVPWFCEQWMLVLWFCERWMLVPCLVSDDGLCLSLCGTNACALCHRQWLRVPGFTGDARLSFRSSTTTACVWLCQGRMVVRYFASDHCCWFSSWNKTGGRLVNYFMLLL